MLNNNKKHSKNKLILEIFHYLCGERNKKDKR